MQVLIIGEGGREHALAWKVAQSNLVTKVFVAPGNCGTAQELGVENVPILVTEIEKLRDFAIEHNIELTIVGPELPLVLGVVDLFLAAGLKIFGPTKRAAQLEGSKAFAKDFLARHNIPTAYYKNFTQIDPAKKYVQEKGYPIVIKADGLAAGKGVIIAHNEREAFLAIEDMLDGNKFGDAGSVVVIEEFLVGEEASFIVMVDGDNILTMATSQDHKARDNGDKGPNTGGMGAYSPAPVVTDSVHNWVIKNVILPTVNGMKAEGNEYTGFLYAGLMISEDGSAKVLEYNCRFGDPETQPIMMRLESDLVALCLSACEKKLNTMKVSFSKNVALGVVLAAKGYPESYKKGSRITGLDTIDPLMKVFHAGTKMHQGYVTSNGGRVLCATALGEDITTAQARAYKLVDNINWGDCYYRTDIGYRAIEREQKT